MQKKKSILVIGHSLAAAENRIPFESLSESVIMCAPKHWQSPGNHKQYSPPSNGLLETLPTTLQGSNTFFFYRNLFELVKRIQPKIVYLWEEPWSLPAWQILRIQKRIPFKFIFFSAENKPKFLPPPFSNLSHRVFNQADSAVVPTPAVASQLLRFGYSGKITIIPLWVIARPLIPHFNTKTLGFIGRLIPLKRLDLLLKALQLMPETTLRVIGDGPQKSKLLSLCNSLGIKERVQFLGHLSNEDISEALKGVALLTLLTEENSHQAEQFGKSVLDAVLSGLPVAVAPTGHLLHWSNEFDTVRTVDCDSPQSLATGLYHALNSPPSKEALQKARESAQKSYGPEQATLRFTQLFTDTLES